MKAAVLFSLLACAIVNCEDLILGETTNKSLIYQTVAQYTGIPFFKREKHVFYNSPQQYVIKGVVAYDQLRSTAKAQVTAGGIGQSYVNIMLESDRGQGLDYFIGIYS